MSHRGGRPGFVGVQGDTLVIPDFRGNRFFNTLGNLLGDPRAGLLFIDFASGDILQLQGRATIDWHPEGSGPAGAERLWRVEVARLAPARRLSLRLALRRLCADDPGDRYLVRLQEGRRLSVDDPAAVAYRLCMGTAALRRRLGRAVRMAIGRYRALKPDTIRFRGAFRSHEEALQHVRPGKLKGYDNDGVSEVSKALMQEVPLWDYPVLYWLKRLSPEIDCVIDAGGHIGVKYRAFTPYLELDRIEVDRLRPAGAGARRTGRGAAGRTGRCPSSSASRTRRRPMSCSARDCCPTSTSLWPIWSAACANGRATSC